MINEAIKIAKRSPQLRFQTGSVIVKNGKVLATGWSHRSSHTLKNYFSIHSEIHSLLRADRNELKGSTIYIATISRKSGNLARSSQPCRACAAALYAAGVVDAYFTAGNAVERLSLTPGGIEKLRLYAPYGNAKPVAA